MSVAKVILLDSISALTPAHAGMVVVTGSHGGRAAVAFAEGIALAGLVFNDAGGGKDAAGLVALDVLQARGIPAAAVAHTSARIGEAADTLAAGVISAVNAAGAGLGVRPGDTASETVRRLTGDPR